jgi:uncharacterized protein YtpQ (UPF0354 family)
MKIKSIIKQVIIFLMLGLLATSIFAKSASEDLMTKKEFTKNFMKALQVEMPEMQFTTISDLHLSAKTSDKDELEIFLNNHYTRYLSAQATFKSICNDEINSIKNKEMLFVDKSLESILPILKPKDYIDTVKAQLKQTNYKEKEFPFYYEKLNDDIFIVYVFDLPDSMQFVSSKDIKKYHIEKDIRTIASKNLEKYYKASKAKVEKIDTGKDGDLYVFSADQTYEASLLLANVFLNQQDIPLKGDLVVFLPARNTVLFAGSKDEAGLHIASAIAKQGFSELAYAISPYGYVYVDGKWKRFNMNFD